MQKVVKFLEAYVQWVALGLGVLWVLWMGYSYWASNPVVADINNDKVTPGDVEDVLLNSTPVTGLDAAHNNQGPYPEDIRNLLNDRSNSDVITPFKDALAKVTAPESWSSPFPAGVPQEIKANPMQGIAAGAASLPDINGTFALEANADGDAVQTGMSVVKRPDPTVPVVIDPRTGQTNVAQQDLLTPPDVSLTNPTAGGAAQPGLVGNPNDPNQPQAAKPIAVVPEEVTWVTVSATLDMKKLAEAFQKAQIPAPAAFTTVLRVELIRQELDPSGNWTNEQQIKDLTNEFKPQFPNGENADPTMQAAYRDWAKQHVADIVEPPFYEVLRGMLWKTAVMPDLAAINQNNVQQANFDPATVKPGQVHDLPPDQKAAWIKWNQEQEKQKAQQHRPKQSPTPSGGGYGPGGVTGEPFFAPPAGPDPAMIERYKQQAMRAQQQQQQSVQQARPQPIPVTGGEIPFDGANGGMQPGIQPNQQQAQNLPPSPFSPAQQVKDLEVWAHDETTVPGKIYRYKLRIFLSNPMWGTQGMAKNEADSHVYSLKTETDWTKPINSPSKRDFFVTNGGTPLGGVPHVGVDYFEWQNGAWVMKPLSVQPGDRIGETPWTVADIRPVGNTNNENRVLLVNDDGSITSRFYKTDKSRKEYKNLLDKIKAATPPAAAQPQPGFGAALGGETPNPGAAAGGARGSH